LGTASFPNSPVSLANPKLGLPAQDHENKKLCRGEQKLPREQKKYLSTNFPMIDLLICWAI